MKLIALKDFANVAGMDVEIKDAVHASHIHKGATFDIGTGKMLKELSLPDRNLVAQLIVSGCVGDGTDTKVVKAVEEEIALDKKREENAKRLNSAASNSTLSYQLVELFKRVGPAAPAK